MEAGIANSFYVAKTFDNIFVGYTCHNKLTSSLTKYSGSIILKKPVA
jgi:hypothetical protein